MPHWKNMQDGLYKSKNNYLKDLEFKTRWTTHLMTQSSRPNKAILENYHQKKNSPFGLSSKDLIKY